MKSTDTTENFNPSEAYAYALKMKEFVEFMFNEVYSCINYGSFHFDKKLGSIHYKNSDSRCEDKTFSMSKVGVGTIQGWHSKVQNGKFPYKFEYFENGSPLSQECCTYELENGLWKLEYHNYYSTEQLEDDGFLFQKSLVLDEKSLFGICCASWLYHMNVKNIYIICEFDVNEMNRIHKVVFGDDK